MTITKVRYITVVPLFMYIIDHLPYLPLLRVHGLTLWGGHCQGLCAPCVSESTARTHIRRTYEKTEAHSKQELIDLLVTSTSATP